MTKMTVSNPQRSKRGFTKSAGNWVQFKERERERMICCEKRKKKKEKSKKY